LIVVISGVDGVVFSAYVVANTELGVVYLVVVLDLRVVGGRAAETAYFVGYSFKWEWMLSLCRGCGGVKTTTAPFFQRDRLYIVGFMSLRNEAERRVNSL
jgi:hypothetical protein